MGFSLRDVKKWALLRRGSAVASDVGAIPATMTGLQTVIDGGSPAEKAALSSSVSGAWEDRSYYTRLAKNKFLRAIPTAFLGNSIVAGVSGISFADQGIIQTPGLVWIKNAGIAGNTSAQMLARLATDIPAEVKLVPFMEMANDIGSLVTVAANRANMRAIAEACIAAGETPLLVLSPPRNGSQSAATNMRAAQEIMAMDIGIDVVDPWYAAVDLATGEYVVGAASDGIHPTFATASIAAAAFSEQLSGAVRHAFRPWHNLSGGDSRTIAGGNCLMLNSTSGIPNGWSKAGTANATIAAAPTGFLGNFARLTGATATGNPYLRKIVTTGWTAGDEQLFVMAVATGGYGASGNVSLEIKVDGIGYQVLSAGTVTNVPAHRIQRAITATTTTQIEVYAKINGAGTGNYIEIGEFEIYNLTKLRS